MLGKSGHVLPLACLDEPGPVIRVRLPLEQFAERVLHAPAVLAGFR